MDIILDVKTTKEINNVKEVNVIKEDSFEDPYINIGIYKIVRKVVLN